MQVIMSNPGLHLAVIGNPGPRLSRRTKTNRSHRKGKTMAFTKKQAQALSKAFRAQGRPVPAKVRRRAGGRSKASYRRARRSAIPSTRRAAAARYRRRMPGIKVTTRMRAGKRKTNRKFGKRHGVRTGQRGTIGFHTGRGRGRRTTKLAATNPRRRRRVRRATRARRNPSVAGWQRGITTLPQRVPALFRGKAMIPNLLFATSGAAGGLVLGGMARGTIMGTLSRFAPGLMGNRLVEGAVGGAITYTGGYLAGTMLIKNKQHQTAFITGAAAAALINAVMPGAVNNLLVSLPVIGPMMARMPGMLGAYVTAPGYQGVGAYVTAPSYQGIGYAGDDALASYQDDALAGNLGAYVTAPGYQGVGMFAASHLDQ